MELRHRSLNRERRTGDLRCFCRNSYLDRRHVRDRRFRAAEGLLDADDDRGQLDRFCTFPLLSVPHKGQLTRGLNPRATHGDTLVMRRSL